MLEGSCGAGPEKHQYGTRWHIKLDREHDHFYIESRDEARGHRSNKNWERRVDHVDPGYEMKSPVARMYSKLSKKWTSLL